MIVAEKSIHLGSCTLELKIEKKQTTQLNYIDLQALKQDEKHVFTYTIYRKNDFYGRGKWIIEMIFNNEIKLKDGIDKNSLLEFINLADKWHVNDLQAGTKQQTDLIENYLSITKQDYEYNLVCKFLKEQNLYIDRDYYYGHAWLYKPLVQSDIDNILNSYERIFKNNDL